ncbi:MAG: hypothetical protein H6993_10765 [Pseudomonadales bacterium]|nr:hypothetical protein [Pseudomonadales bacterium]MCP5184437.1 hypothetical protein [Pseudomonadales bacterium]
MKIPDIRLLTAEQCRALHNDNAQTLDGLPIGAQGVLPVTTTTWNDYYRCAPPPADEPWWLCRETTPTTYDGLLWVDHGLAAFAGHFPGAPVLPGVILLLWMEQAAGDAFGPLTFTGLRDVKFRAPVTPGTHLLLRLTRDTGRVTFAWSCAGERRAQGVLLHHD